MALTCIVACAATLEIRYAAAAGGAHAVDDVETGDVGLCKVESWTSFADNRDFIGTVSPTCVVDLGRPVELIGLFSRFRAAGEWGSIAGFKAKTNLIPIAPGKIGLGLIAGTTVELVSRAVNGVFVTVPVSFQVHEKVRAHVNVGWFNDPRIAAHAATWGAGFEWNFVDKLTLTGEVFGFAGPMFQTRPRAQVGLRFTPQQSFDIDVTYGRNILGDNANWITVGLNVRFNAFGNGK